MAQSPRSRSSTQASATQSRHPYVTSLTSPASISNGTTSLALSLPSSTTAPNSTTWTSLSTISTAQYPLP
ncbi:hypothetical protein ACS0TY_014725 [Phlomoides rotata]